MAIEANLPPDLDPNCLWVNSTIDPETLTPQVLWAHQGAVGVIGVNLARERAKLLFQAAAIAESEGLILKAFIQLEKAGTGKEKGFGKYKPSKMPLQVMQLVRDQRPPLPDDIEVIFGYETQLALVNFYWYGQKTQLEPDEARSHAQALMSVAEGAETDGFFYYFVVEKLDLPPGKAYAFILDFQQYRDRRHLEELFQQG